MRMWSVDKPPPFLTSVLDGNEWPASPPGEGTPGNHCIGDCVGHRANRFSKSVVSHYMNWATTTAFEYCTQIKFKINKFKSEITQLWSQKLNVHEGKPYLWSMKQFPSVWKWVSTCIICIYTLRMAPVKVISSSWSLHLCQQGYTPRASAWARQLTNYTWQSDNEVGSTE
jgi:hypothetical protein